MPDPVVGRLESPGGPPAADGDGPCRRAVILHAMSPVARPPRIVITLMVAHAQSEPEITLRKIALYVDAVARHGGVAIPLDATSSRVSRDAAFAHIEVYFIESRT